MPHDPVKVGDVKAWLGKVSGDLRISQLCLEANPPLTEGSLFHSQQAVEKSLKAFLTWHDEPFKKTHDLVTIGKQVSKIEPSLEALAKKSSSFTEYAWKFRYPKAGPPTSIEEARNVLKIAQEVHQAVLSKLPKDL